MSDKTDEKQGYHKFVPSRVFPEMCTVLECCAYRYADCHTKPTDDGEGDTVNAEQPSLPTVRDEAHSELEAGRELDAWIAERVFGWKVEKGSSFNDWLQSDPKWFPSEKRTLLGFSTDIAAAWPILEALQQRGAHRCVVQYYTDYKGDLSYACHFEMGGADYNASALTAPLAICLAALKATGETK